MLKILYIRVSSKGETTIRQEVKAKEYNIPMKCVYIGKVSGKNVTERPLCVNMNLKQVPHTLDMGVLVTKYSNIVK